MDGPLKVNRLLLSMAMQPESAFRKGAVALASGMDPAAMGGGGGAPPMDPAAMGGAPPMDPAAMGGAPPAQPPPMDPAMQAQQMMAAGGGAGAGKAGGKKIEQQVLDTKLYNLTYMVARLCEQAKIPIPPSMLVGPPPDPAAQTMVQQDMASMQTGMDPATQDAAVGLGGGDPAAAGGGGGAIGTIDPMKAASAALLALEPVVSAADPFEGTVPASWQEKTSLAQRARARSLLAQSLMRS